MGEGPGAILSFKTFLSFINKMLLLLLLSRFSRVQLCDPTDSSSPGSPVPGILQARTLEWVAISFSNAWKWKVKVKSFSRVWLLATPWTAAHQAPLSMGFSRQEYWSGLYNIQLKTNRGVLFLHPSDAYVRSILYLLYTIIKLYYTKGLSNQTSSLALDWILLLRGQRIPASLRDSTTFQCLTWSIRKLFFCILPIHPKSILHKAEWLF